MSRLISAARWSPWDSETQKYPSQSSPWLAVAANARNATVAIIPLATCARAADMSVWSAIWDNTRGCSLQDISYQDFHSYNLATTLVLNYRIHMRVLHCRYERHAELPTRELLQLPSFARHCMQGSPRACGEDPSNGWHGILGHHHRRHRRLHRLHRFILHRCCVKLCCCWR